MKYQFVSVAIAASVLLVSGATTASAQGAKKPATRAASPSAPVAMGPAIPGFCIAVRQRIGGSVAGKFAISRFNQLKQQSDAEMQTEATALQTDIKAFQDTRETLPADQVKSRGSALQTRIEQFQQKQQLREAEMQATQQKAVGTVLQAAEPIQEQVFAQRGCSVLIEGSPIMMASPAMDITSAIIQGLDAKLQSFELDRVHIDPAQAAQAAAQR